MTHCDRLRAVLADGEWHDHHELYRLGMIVHSRVADLRRKGFTVESMRDGDDYLYRLAGRLDGIAGSLSPLGIRGAVEPVGSPFDADPCCDGDDGTEPRPETTLLGGADGELAAGTPVVSSASIQLQLGGAI